MKTNLIDKSFALFSKTTKIDGRYVVVASIVLYFAFLFVAHFFVDYQWVWQHLGVPARLPSFADLRNITSAVDCQHAGYNPLVSDPCDPWHRPMNYPRIWLYLFSALHLQQPTTTIMGICLAAIFYLSAFLFMGTVNAYEGGLYAILLCSPPTMLAVERGNNDLIIFVLLTMVLQALRQFKEVRWLPYVLIGLCSLLKLYPFCVYILALREKPRTSLAILLVSTVIFAIYLFLIRDDLRAINSAIPRSFAFSYGSHVFFDRLQAHHLLLHSEIVSSLAVLFVIGGAYILKRKTPPLKLSDWNSKSLMISAILYAVTFAFGNNWNYRLIILIFAVPALLELIKTPNQYMRSARFLLVVMVLSLWLSAFMNPVVFLIKETANWLMFVGFSIFLFHLLPNRTQWRGTG